jgi:tetratricopeptide (TPR) repeat protein
MSNDDWFRHKTWTPVDRAEFSARVKRSRGAFHKAQYARIQAYELQTVGTPETLRGAIDLLDTILAEWRSEAQLAAVHHQYAQCLLRLGQQERAIESFREVFDAQRQRPGHITQAHLDFGWLCISVPLPQLYSEVLGLLDEFQYVPVFPAHVYRDAAIRAVIHHSRGEHRLARDYAHRALSTQLPRHPTFNVVTTTDSDVHAELQSIVA